MNGFAQHGLDEDAFGEKGSNIVQAFDYFRKATFYYILPIELVAISNPQLCKRLRVRTQLTTTQPKQNPNT